MGALLAGHHGTLGQPSAQVIDSSLKFNSGSSNYLSRTPSSASNRKTWTWSGWVQKTGLGTQSFIFSCLPSGSYFQSYFSADKLYLQANTPTFYVETTQVFRDLGWYHIVIVLDTPQTDPTDRLKLYVNGEEASFGTDQRSSLTQNSDLRINDTQSHSIGSQQPLLGVYANFNLSQVYFIDGQALGPENFGFTDPLTNTWRPKKYKVELAQTQTVQPTYVSNSAVLDPTYAFDGSSGTEATYSGVGSWLSFTVSDASNLTVPFRIRNDSSGTGQTVAMFTDSGGSSAAGGTWGSTGNNNLSPAISTTVDDTYTFPSTGTYYLRHTVGSDSNIFVYKIGGAVITGGNSFYLPMDGNSPIGEDKSGNGNNWTPVNFGGSVALPKATGALPILNTDGGGNVARPGTRTDANAANLFLAVPLIGSTNDVSNQINSGSTTKVATNSGVDASNAQSNFYGGSHYWGANSDSLTYAEQGSELVFGTGDYTIEFWFFDDSGHTGTGGRNYLFDNRIGGSVVGDPPQILGFIDGSTEINFSSGDGSIAHTVPSTNNRWIHYAAVRSSGTTTLYLDGISVGTVSGSTNFTNNGIGIGRATDANYGMAGYIQDFRIYKGVAKYTSDFVVPATSPDILPDTPSGVSGGSKLAKVTDGAVSFDGTGDYLTVPYAADTFSFGTGDFTIEAFVNMSAVAYTAIISSTNTSINATNHWLLGFSNTANMMSFKIDGSGNSSVTSNFSGYYSKWTHVAVSRESGTIRLFFDGVLKASATDNSSLTGDSGNAVKIGQRYTNQDAYSINGFISNIRILKGTALYTTNFTPPTRELTNVTNTKLLCCQSTYEPGSAVVAPSVSGVNNGTQWSFYTTTTEGPLGTKDFYSTGNDANHLFDGVNTDLCYGGYGLGGATDSDIIFAPPNGITVSSKLEVYVGYYSKIKVNGTDYNTGGESTAAAWVTVSNGGGNFTGSLNKLILENTSNANVVRAGAIRIDDSTVLLDPLSPQGDVVSTNFNPFTTDINAVRGQETGYPTLNPLDMRASTALSNGNLTVTGGGSAWYLARSTQFLTTGKYYWEYKWYGNVIDGSNGTQAGLKTPTSTLSASAEQTGSFAFQYTTIYQTAGSNNSVVISPGSTTPGDCVMFAYDADAGLMWFGVNGKWNNGANPASGSNSDWTSLPTTGLAPFAGVYGTAIKIDINFGQKPFKYAPPDGFQPLNAANVRPETVITRPDHYVGATTWSGNDSNPRYISTPNLKADLVWIKTRDAGYHHGLFDSVRGAGGAKRLYSDETFAEGGTGGAVGTAYGELSAFNNGGFTVNTGTTSDIWVNNNGNTYVAWCWKAGGNKNTFNVDDVGYASASDVNMSVGSLNSSVYNQTQTWSNNITTTGNSGNFIAKTAMFDTDFTNYAHCNGDGLAVTVTFTINPPIQVNKSITLFGGLTSYNAGTISINDGPTFGLSLCATVNPAFTDSTVIPVNGLVNKITVKRTSTAAAGLLLYGWKFDDQRLIDNGLSAPNAPSIAPTGCSVNTKSKFGIYTWNGHGSTNETLPHRLGAKPDFMICKKKSTGGNSWVVWHKSIADTRYLILNSQAAAELDATLFNSHLNDGDNLWTLGTNNSISDTGQSAVAYLWCDVPGLQKFGSFEANQSADGPFIELGFRPAVVWIKNIDNYDPPYDWVIYDNARSTINPNDKFLCANLGNVENSGSGGTETTRYVDFLSNGFKVRTASTAINLNAHTQIYCAWAEAPAINLYGGGAKAR